MNLVEVVDDAVHRVEDGPVRVVLRRRRRRVKTMRRRRAAQNLRRIARRTSAQPFWLIRWNCGALVNAGPQTWLEGEHGLPLPAGQSVWSFGPRLVRFRRDGSSV